MTSLQRCESVDRLSPREGETLALMAAGWSNARICERLLISSKTLERHISSIFFKLRLLPNESENRRVLAVLHHLDEAPSARAS